MHYMLSYCLAHVCHAIYCKTLLNSTFVFLTCSVFCFVFTLINLLIEPCYIHFIVQLKKWRRSQRLSLCLQDESRGVPRTSSTSRLSANWSFLDCE